MLSTRYYITFLCCFHLLLTGCGAVQSSEFASLQPSVLEPTYYGTPTDYSSSPLTTTVSGAAYFQIRVMNGNYRLTDTLSDPTDNPIRYAEYHVYLNNQRIQQGETSATGAFSFVIPRTPGTYEVRVFSRANNRHAIVSVLDLLSTKQPHKASMTFSVAANTNTVTNVTVTASANNAVDPYIPGGAFNIYDQILRANEYIRAEIGRNNGGLGIPANPNDNNWWTAPKSAVFWRAGFNPYSYFSTSDDTASFYIPSTDPTKRMLFILGGKNGDTSVADTDHFDNSIILHEYMHFLEDTVSKSSSPGGYHNGNALIDPRLAWSEGLATFLQAAVKTKTDVFPPSGDPRRLYIDTAGYGNSAASSYTHDIGVDGESAHYDSVAGDPTFHSGIFREMSVSRLLYKITRSSGASLGSGISGGGIPFSDVWKTLTSMGLPNTSASSYSFNNTSEYPIPNGGLFNALLAKNRSIASIEDILENENQIASTSGYATRLKPQSGACTFGFNGAAVDTPHPIYTGVTLSNPLLNNHFYVIKKSDLAVSGIELVYNSTASNQLDLDLIVYKKSYEYIEYGRWDKRGSNVVSFSRKSSGNEAVSVSGVKDDFFVLNVKVNSQGKNSSALQYNTPYQIRLSNGDFLCAVEP